MNAWTSRFELFYFAQIAPLLGGEHEPADNTEACLWGKKAIFIHYSLNNCPVCIREFARYWVNILSETYIIDNIIGLGWITNTRCDTAG